MITVLSLFDGYSTAQQALKNMGIPVRVYLASEIDKYALAVTQKRFPDTAFIGDVREVSAYKEVDLLIGGSPCQDLSIAKQGRKGLEGERSGLFYEYVRVLKENMPKYFILENVASMPKEAKETITKELYGIEPIMINASLVSAQNRKRLFWVSSRVDLCYLCKYEQILTKIQYKGEDRKTSSTSIGKLLPQESKEKNRMQDMQNIVSEEKLNSEVLLKRVYEYQQEEQRQQTDTKKEKLSEEILREKKERIIGIWEKLSPEQQGEFSKILQKIHFQARSQDEKITERGVEKEQKNYQYDWERGIVGYVEKNKQGVCVLRFFGGHNSRPHNPSEQEWDERFREFTATVSELQFIQEGQVNICSCCGGVIPIKYEQVQITQPEDRGIMLSDIIESGSVDRWKPHCIDAHYYKGTNWETYKHKRKRQVVRVGALNKGGQGDCIYSIMGKSVTLSANGGGRGAKTGLYVVPVALRNRGEEKLPEYNNSKKANSLTTVQTDSMVEEDFVIRKLTPTECLRLQSMPDDYFEVVMVNKKPLSDTQKYKMCGNSFNCAVIEHILSHIF